MSDDFSSNVHIFGSVTVGGAATGEMEHPGGQDLEAVAGRRCTIDLRGNRADRGTPGDRHRRGIPVADGTLMPGTKNDDGGEGFNSRATFTATAKTLRKSGSPFPTTGMLFAVLISVASPPASGSTGCDGYVKPLNRAESFWRQAEEQQVRACIGRFGAAPSDNNKNLTPLHLAAWFSGNPAVIAALLKGGAEPNAKTGKGFTPLHVAAQWNSTPAVVEALLKGGAEPNAKAGKGFTPLHLAAQWNSNPAVVEALLKGGAEPNAKTGKGSTPLHLAAEWNSTPAVVEALLKGGAEPNAKTGKGDTPLHQAAGKNSNPAVVEALLKGGAEPNAKTGEGATPLHLAASFNSDPTIIEALLKAGADPEAKALGKTAFEMARNNAKLRGSDAYRRLREAHDARQEPKAAPDTLDLTKEDYSAIQRLLNEKGFPAGPADGQWEPKSRGALQAFQAQAGLARTGVPDKATRKALGFQNSAKSGTRVSESGAKDDVALRDACREGQELKPGQGCSIPGGGEFRVETDGCVKDVPDVPGPTSMGQVSMSGDFNSKTGENTISTCIRGHVGKGEFSARQDAEKSIWRIESLPGYTVAVTRARPAAAVDATRADSNEDAGGACVAGLELSPGQSCTYSAVGTFTVLEGGCFSVSGTFSFGRVCGADFTFNGLRATPVNDVNFRIDALP